MELKYIAGIVLLVVVATFVLISPSMGNSHAQSEKTMEKIARNGELSVCYIVYPPTVIKDPNSGKLSGEMIDAIEYIAKDAGLNVEYKESAWGTFIAALQSGQCDVAVTGLFSKIERAKSVAFTRPMFYIGNSILVRKGDTRFASLADFNRSDVKIAVIQGEVGHLYVQKNLPNAEVTVLPGADISLALTQVTNGQADAAFTDGWTIEQYAKEHNDTIDFLTVNPSAAYGINPVSWAVRQADVDLLNFLNTAITDLEADGKFIEWEKLYDAHWLRPKFELQKS